MNANTSGIANISDYIYLSYRTKNTFTYTYGSKPITGLLLVESPPTYSNGVLRDVTWNNRTYHPCSKDNAFERGTTATLNLNEGTWDYPRYLYYTNDGWDTGAPILTGVEYVDSYDKYKEADRNKKQYMVHPYVYGDRQIEPSDWDYLPADFLSPGSNNSYKLYLLGTYHHHTLDIGYDDEQHWTRCSTCGFDLTNKHSLTITNEGSFHKAVCSDCDYVKEEAHYDKNGDSKCDYCGCRFALTADDMPFSNFPDAWNYAISQDHPVTITLWEPIDANLKDGKRVQLGNSTWLAGISALNNEVTITGVSGAWLTVSQDMPFYLTGGKLTVNADIVSTCEDSTRIFALSGSALELKDCDITLTKATQPTPSSSTGTKYGVITVADSGSVEASGSSIVFSNDIEGSAAIAICKGSANTSLDLADMTIKGAETSIYLEGCADAQITDGYYDAGDGCALRIANNGSRTSSVTITGGEFVGATCVDIDSASTLLIEDGIFKGTFTGKNVTECMPEGASAAEIDADGNITQQIDIQTLKDAGNSYTFTERTQIGFFGGTDPAEPEIVSFAAPADVYAEYGTSIEDIVNALPTETTANTAYYDEAVVLVVLTYSDAATAIGGKYDPETPFVGGSLDLKIPLTATASSWPTGINKTCSTDIPVTLHIVSQSNYVAVPVASVESGEYHEDLAVELDLETREGVAGYFYTKGFVKEGIETPTKEDGAPYQIGESIQFSESPDVQYLSVFAYDENGVASGIVTYYYTVTLPHAVTVNNGSGSGTYYLGDTVEVAADEPAVGKVFDHWTIDQGTDDGSIDVSKPEIAFTMPAEDIELTACYVDKVYTVSVSVDGDGTAKADKDSAIMGETVTLTATPADGYHFMTWRSQDVMIEDGSFVMPADDVEIIAVFEKDAPEDYILIAGAGTTWQNGGQEGAAFASNAPFAKFKQVLVDGAVVDPANYKAWEGSTWVELTPAYLGTLSVGKHELTIVSTDGSVSTDFYINAPSQPTSDDPTTPATGDSSPIGLLVGLMTLGCLIAVAGMRRRLRD